MIRLEYLLEAADLPKVERSEAAVFDLIGCLDPRTARHPMRGLAIAIDAVPPDLTERRAATSELGELPQINPGTPPEERLAILFDAEIRAGQRARRYREEGADGLLVCQFRRGSRSPVFATRICAKSFLP